MTSSVNNDSKDDNNNNNNTFHHPVTRSNGGAPNTKRSAATPNSAQKKKQGALALAGLFNGGDSTEEDGKVAEVEPPALETITEVVTLSSTSNAGSFETLDVQGNNNNNSLGVDLNAANDKRKVGEISEEHHDPLMKYVETECGIVPPPAVPQQQQQMMMTTGGGGGGGGGDDDTLPRKKMRRSTDPMYVNNALPDPRGVAAAPGHTEQHQHVRKPAPSTTVVSTPQKVASILASQLPKTSVPPGVPMPRLPGVQQFLPPSSGKTSFEQLMQVSLLMSIFINHDGLWCFLLTLY